MTEEIEVSSPLIPGIPDAELVVKVRSDVAGKQAMWVQTDRSGFPFLFLLPSFQPHPHRQGLRGLAVGTG